MGVCPGCPVCFIVAASLVAEETSGSNGSTGSSSCSSRRGADDQLCRKDPLIFLTYISTVLKCSFINIWSSYRPHTAVGKNCEGVRKLDDNAN